MTKKAFFPGGKKSGRPYSPAVAANGFLFISGQIPLNSEGKLVAGDIRLETRQCFENLSSVVQEAGVTLDNLVKVNIFVKDLANYDAVNSIYAEYVAGEVLPARSFVQVADLPLGATIEIEAVAAL
ncbi:MAG: hypothetical protein A2293_12965 [Elusimicrobia bacterium RIFOXYB2_FULL_49_7]|nr:MAG: hypothetical protein A2293_12965 [Elusimicrobia bacterium RIFOXYB2_FULL_49_7]